MSSDSDPLPFHLIGLIVLVLLNGFFVAAEYALVKVRASRVEHLANGGNVFAKMAHNMRNHLDAYLSACQLGITFSSLGLGWLGMTTLSQLLEPMFLKMGLGTTYLHTASFMISFAIIAIFHLTIGEQFPKTIAIRKSEPVTLWIAAPLFLFYKLVYPLIWLVNTISNALLRLTGVEKADDSDIAHSEEEIRMMMKESQESGYIDQAELALVDNIFEFSDTLAREIMIPRTEMDCLYAQMAFEENVEIALKEMRTRYPVCHPDKDHIIGFVHIKDLLKPVHAQEKRLIHRILRPLIKVPESMQISQLLKMMQKRKVQMALVIDEYGGTAGLVTLEDILEEIVGEIQDEFDQERPSIEKRDESSFSLDARLLIEEVNDEFGLAIDTSDYDTIGGWMYAQIEMPPRKDQIVDYNGEYRFIIEETDHMRISRVLVRRLAESESATA